MNSNKKSGNNDTSLSLRSGVADLIAAITSAGIKPKETVKALSHVIQSGIQGKLLKGFGEAYESLVADGKIDPKYIESTDGMTTFQEILRALDQDYIDEGRVKALQSIFLNGAIQNKKNQSTLLTLELMKHASSLSTGEIIVLMTAYELTLVTNTDGPPRYDMTLGSWIRLIAEESGLSSESLVESEEEKLTQKKMIATRTAGGNVSVNTHYRLTDLGMKLCEFIRDPIEN